MNQLILVGLAQVVDILVGAVTKKPELEPHLGSVLVNILPALSHAAGETPEQTKARQASAQAVWDKWADKPIG